MLTCVYKTPRQLVGKRNLQPLRLFTYLHSIALTPLCPPVFMLAVFLEAGSFHLYIVQRICLSLLPLAS